MWGFSKREDGTVDFSTHGITVNGATGDLQFGRVVACQIGADRRPALPFVGRLEDHVAGRIEHVGVVGREDNRVGPSKAILVLDGTFARCGLWPGGDQADLLGAFVVALQTIPTTRRRADGAQVDDVVVFGVNGDVATLTRTRNNHRTPRDGCAGSTAGDGQRTVVLLGTVDAVGSAVVDTDVVILRRGLIVDARPRHARIKGNIGTAVVALDHAVVAVGVNPQVVVVAVWSVDLVKGGTGVGGFPKRQVVDVHGIWVNGIGMHVHVVPGT